MTSINQNATRTPLPDFRNFGVVLRIVLMVNFFTVLAAFLQAYSVSQLVPAFVDMAAWVQPVLILNLSALFALSPLLQRLGFWAGQVLILVLSGGSAVLWLFLCRWLGFIDIEVWSIVRAIIFAGGGALIILYYFALRSRAFSPAIAEARLEALTARIRPHFLFNSLNAVLSLIRSEPRRAEAALEELSDLFRAVMREPRDVLPLTEELSLCAQYLNLEKLRLGERLQVRWNIKIPEFVVHVPPLMLQPLIENAVYHGIEPLAQGGIIQIDLCQEGEALSIYIKNPCPPDGRWGQGHQMALANIRERLNLYYDLEARLETKRVELPDGGAEYEVHIMLPVSKVAK